MQPNYRQNNIVNLMSSILHGCGGSSHHPQLNPGLAREITSAKNVVLLVIDGLGLDSLQQLPKKSFLRRQLRQPLTTVFPSTTTAAITTFLTGLTPQEHGMTAWWMFLKEIGSVAALLPWKNRLGQSLELKVKGYSHSLSSLLPRSTHVVMKKSVINGQYNALFAAKGKRWGYRSLGGMILNVQRAVRSSLRKKYIYAYWSGFDDHSHYYGKRAGKTRKHLRYLNQALQSLAQRLQGTNTLLLITADHGSTTTSANKVIYLNDHPALRSCLTLPVCGEPRAAFCYVHPHKAKEFEKYAQKLSSKLSIHHSSDLVRRGFFGSRFLHPQLLERVGDYVLIPKNDGIIVEALGSEERKFLIGNHGGLSKEEMTVPLIICSC